MKVYLKEEGEWKLFEGTKEEIEKEFKKREIVFKGNYELKDLSYLGDRFTAGDGFKAGYGFKAGNDFTAGDRFTAGNDFTAGDRFTAGNDFTAGDRFTAGYGFKAGDGFTAGNRFTAGYGFKAGNDFKAGYGFKAGNWFTAGDKENSENLNKIFIETFKKQGHKLIATKWVCKDRTSLNFDGGEKIKYEKGKIVEAEKAIISDQQCGVGLHILPYGHRPEWYGLCEANHDYIPLTVEVNPDDICFAGFPGVYGKMRVKRLKVLD